MKKFFFALLLPLFAGAAWAAESSEFIEGAFYKSIDEGSLVSPRQAKRGIIATNNRHSELYVLEGNQLKTLVDTRGCGRYINLNKEGTLVGFKSINEQTEQAPAILNIATGEVTLLEPYAFQCGQVSFADDGTIAYTVGDNLIVCRNGKKMSYNLGFYTNIANISPDGKTVAFSSFEGEPMLIDLATERITKISEKIDMYNPKWSPDGEKIVYEQAKMELFVYEKSKKSFNFLSKGSDAQWTNDSKNLVFAKGEYENGEVFRFKGTSVVKMSFDGKEKRTIIPLSKECPQSVGLLDNNRLAVPYVLGENRRLAAVSLSNTKAGVEETLYTLPKEKSFGKRHKTLKQIEFTSSKKSTSANQPKSGSIGPHAIPYVNQVHDVPPSYAGCVGYGYSACAPSTSCMLLGYYGRLNPHGVVSRAPGKPWGDSQYSYYVGLTYTSRTGYTFNLAANGNGCYATGGFGYMWNNSYPSNRMGSFYTNNGVKSARYENSYAALRRECAANRPYSWCITSAYSDGHLILAFRSDARCILSGSWQIQDGFTGSVVVHDPYGDANVGWGWAGTDGRYSTYDMSGYNNGYTTMYLAWGVCVENAAAAPPPPSDTEKPKIHRARIVGKDRNSFWAYAYVTDNKGVSKVEFPVWTTAGDQDDLKWHQAGQGSWTESGQTYNYRVEIKRSEHKNEYGPYAVHVYANDAAGNRAGFAEVAEMPYTIDQVNPTISRRTTVPANVNSYAALMYATDNKKVVRAQFPTWTTANEQDDIVWHNAASGKWVVNGQEYNYRYIVNTSDHKNERGAYTTHGYAWDFTGNSASTYLSFNFDDNPEVIFDDYQKNPWNISTEFGLDGGSGDWSYETTDGHFTAHFKSGGNNPRIWMNRSNIKNQKIVWSFLAKVSSGTVTFNECGYENGLKKKVTLNTSWQRITGSGTAGSAQYDALVFYGGSLPNGVTLSVKDYSVKLASDNIVETNNIALVIAKRGQPMPTIVPPTKEDYTFQGYFSEKNGAGTKYYNADGTSAKNMDKTTQTLLHSHWQEITDPRIKLGTGNIVLGTEAGRTTSQTIKVKGYYLSTDSITLTLTGANTDIITISKTKLGKTGGDITISYAPTEAGNHSATLTATAGSITQTIQITAAATKRVNPVNTNTLFSKIPYVIVETESTQANDVDHKTTHDGGNTTHGENINFLTYGKRKAHNDAVTKNGKNADRVIFKTNKAEMVMSLPGVSINKIKFMGGLHESHDNKFQGYLVDVRYKTVNDKEWRGVDKQSVMSRIWADDSLTFNKVDNVVKLKIKLTNDAGRYIGLSGIALYGGFGGQILNNTNNSGIYDNPYLYWKAYDINNNLIGQDNGFVDSYEGYNANFDGVRNFWQEQKGAHKTIRFVMRGEDVNLMTCDLIGSKGFDVDPGEHIILENMGNAPIGLAVGGFQATNGRSFFEVKGNGKVTLGASVYGLMSDQHQWISVSQGNSQQQVVTLEGILGEIRGNGHSIYVNGGCNLLLRKVVGLEQAGSYEGKVNGVTANKTEKTFYNIILDPSGANLIKNGGFEDHAMWERGTDQGIVGYDSRAKSGNKGYYVKGDAGSSEIYVYGKYNNRPKLVNNHAYYARIYGYQEKANHNDNVEIYFGSAEPKLCEIPVGTAGQWNLYSTVVSSHNPGGLKDEQRVRFDYDNENAAGEMWFDDFMLVDLTEYAEKNGLNVSSLTKEVCDQLFSQAENTIGETKIEVEGEQLLPTIEIPVREGYTFGGYYDGRYGIGTKYINADGTASRTWDKGTAAVLYAKWTPNAEATLTLNLNGGEYTGETEITAQKGSFVTLEKPTREGFTFTGWSGTGEKWLTRAQAQYGHEIANVDNNGDQFLNEATSYIFRDCSQENELTFRNGYNNDIINLGRRHLHTDNLTINVWAWMEDWAEFASTKEHMRLFSTTESGGWNMEVYDTNKIAFAINNGGYIHIKTGKTYAELNNSGNGWHMFTLVVDNDSRQAKSYIDGNFVGSVENNAFIKYSPGNTLILGGESWVNRLVMGNVLTGKMKNFGITNRSLSSNEISQLFENQNETYYYMESDAALTANWTPTIFPITYKLEGETYNANKKFQYSDMSTWEKSEEFTSNSTVTYDPESNTNTISCRTVPFFEKLYKAIPVEPNQTYELKLTYNSNIGSGDFHYSDVNFLPLQVVNTMDSDLDLANELSGACRIRIYPGSDTQTLRFNVGSDSLVYLVLNHGFLKDDKTYNITISDLSFQKLATYNLPYGQLPKPEKEGYSFGGWYTSPNCNSSELVTDSTFVTNVEADTLYALWAVCRIGNQPYGRLEMAVAQYVDGDTIEMLNNTTENVVLDKVITLVGNDKILTGNLELTPFSRLKLIGNFTVEGKCVIGSEGNNEQKKAANVVGNLTVNNHAVFKFSVNMNNVNDPTQFKHWISVPFEVNMKDIDGTGLLDMAGRPIAFKNAWYYVWNIMNYDTEARDKGEADAYKRVEFQTTLNAKEGHVLQFIAKEFGQVTMEFPSVDAQIVMNKNDETGKECANFATGIAANHNWQLCGQPYFCNTLLSNEANGVKAFAKIVGKDNHFDYFLASDNEELRPYESYFVQHAGTFHFQNPAALETAMGASETYLLTLSKAEVSRRMGIILAENAADNYTIGHDLAPVERDHKMQFYSKAKGNDLVFAELKTSVATVPLGYEVAENGEFTIALSQKESLTNYVTLEDKANNTFTNLREANYTFNSESGVFDNRFVLHFSDSLLSIPATNNENILVYTTNNSLEIKNIAAGTNIALFDVTGKLLSQQNAQNNAVTFGNLPSGFYLLAIGNQPVKIVIR